MNSGNLTDMRCRQRRAYSISDLPWGIDRTRHTSMRAGPTSQLSTSDKDTCFHMPRSRSSCPSTSYRTCTTPSAVSEEWLFEYFIRCQKRQRDRIRITALNASRYVFRFPGMIRQLQRCVTSCITTVGGVLRDNIQHRKRSLRVGTGTTQSGAPWSAPATSSSKGRSQSAD